MRFMLMMHAPRGTGDYQIGSWSPDEITAHIDFMRTLNVDLKNAGEFVAGEGLAPPSEARLVQTKNGVPAVTDGPFPEGKEFLAGYWIVDVENAEEAYRIAARASAAPGPGGAPANMPIEVRQVMSSAPEELLQ